MINKIKENSLNIECWFLFCLSIIVTITYSICKPLPVIVIVLLQASSLGGILFLKYTVQIGLFSNKFHSLFYRRNQVEISDEYPSTFLLGMGKFLGYLLILFQLLCLFIPT